MKTKIKIRQLEIDFRDSVVAVTQGNNIALSGGAPDTLDGVTLQQGHRVLVKDQTVGSENGIYEVQTLGTGANGTWVRVADMDDGTEVTSGVQVLVREGTNDGRRIYLLTTPDTITVGTTAMTWERLNDTDTGVSLTDFVFNETPTGAIDGSNKVFTTANPFQTGTLQVFLNGQLLVEGATEDYTITGADEITLADAPRSAPGNPDVLRVHYIK